jgi:AbrB family looped-hinge helix DNA binding protein
MSTVTLSPKFQVVIPQPVRDVLKLKPGQKLQVFALGGRIEIVPIRPMKEMRGFLKGLNSDFEREPDRL